jgi:ferredoxin-NADP reductase
MTATSAPRATAWQRATLLSARQETPRVKTLRFALETWPGHLAGQHVDVRLTADDGYRAERSYSIASAPGGAELEITVDRLDDGEVSPFLTDELRPDDSVELRGPLGRYFVWSAAAPARPLLLLAGGSGIVPLMCMLRHRREAGSVAPAGLLYSTRTRADVIYRDELAALAEADPALTIHVTLTRDGGPGWSGGTGRSDAATVQDLMRRVGGGADSFVCGSHAFVEADAALLVQAGQPPQAIRTERFGPVGA